MSLLMPSNALSWLFHLKQPIGISGEFVSGFARMCDLTSDVRTDVEDW
jgi:hypothetical protein